VPQDAPASFYESVDERVVATELTRGPWHPDAQHGGPPIAFLGRAFERLPDAEDFQIGRLTFEFLGPVPIGQIETSIWIARPGRRVQLIEGVLQVNQEARIRARGWRLRKSTPAVPPEAIIEDPPPPGVETAKGGRFYPTEDDKGFFPSGQEHGYHTGMDGKFLAGGFLQPGPARAWFRMLHPLVDDEETTPLQRALIVADMGNGVSSALDYQDWTFINVDLTVQLERLPVGEWICVDAVTRPQPDGVGSSDSVLSDDRGRFGRALQTLLFSERQKPA
jgi:hypothetical protein